MNKKILIFLFTLVCILCIKNNNVFAYDTGREVYVRHINKANGKIISGLSNTNQEVINISGNSSLSNNSNSDDAEFEYNEYYNYAISSTMKITKTLVMQVNGIKYDYLGYTKCTMPSVDEAYNIMESKKSAIRAGTAELDQNYLNNQANAQYTTVQSNYNDVTIIDFYYNEKDVNSISPKLYSNTNVWNGNDAGLTSNVTYLPSGGMLYPYFETPKYVVKDLSYEKAIVDNKICYKVNNFVVYRLEEAYLKSSDSVHIGASGEIEITGTLVDNTHPAAAITGIGTTSPVFVQGKENITNDLNSLVSNFNNANKTVLPGRGDIDKTDGEKAGPGNYSSGIIIQSDVLNGLRSAKGNVVYQEYNVLNGSYGNRREYESTNDHYINVYTPVKLNDPQVTTTSNASIDHTTINSSTVILADDATFEIKLSCGDLDFTYYNNITPEQKARFVNYYYLIFDFDVVHNGRTYPKGTAVRLTNQSAYNDGYTYFYGQVAPNETLSRDASNHKIIVLASSANMSSNDLLQYVVDQEVAIQLDKTQDSTTRKYLTDSGDNTANFTNDIEQSESHTPSQYTKGVTMYGDGYYFAMKTITVTTASKIYDFKITDCSDLAYKSAFRDTNTNNLASNSGYYSGIRRMFVYTNANKEFTTLLDRDGIKINGTTSTRTLPLGPYKHTTASYINAPKLGYRFSFDLKTTGYYMPTGTSSTRKITIKPTYYYLSKDGSQIIKDITLYYKDETDNYKQFNGSGYKIYFVPNDGSRYTNDTSVSNISYLSKKQEGLNIGSSSKEFDLTDSMMALDDSGYVQTWYGEYKLPNTTIAVRNGDSINNALTDGYIGIKFDITCYDTKINQTISYSALNKSANSAINTTQWDYEGYLGFSNPGQQVTTDTSLRIQLEKGIWSINSQELYDFVKGTVILYDIDNRAADDIN